MHMTYRSETHRKLVRNSGQIKSKLFWLNRAIEDGNHDEAHDLLDDMSKIILSMSELLSEN